MTNKYLRTLAISAFALAAVSAAPASAGDVKFNLINIGGVEQGTTAYYGFRAAADYWSSVLQTKSAPVTVNFQVGFSDLGPNILGSTRSFYDVKAAVSVVNRINASKSGAFDASLALPTLHDGYFGAGTGLQMYTPGYTDPVARTGIDNSTKVYDTDAGYNNSVLGLTVANARAIGYGYAAGTIDANIQFSSTFDWDFKPVDGIDANHYDFVGVAIHEMGHALGFVSAVDDYDFLGGPNGPAANEVCLSDGTLCKNYPANDDWWGKPLDLFRYSADGKLDWTTNTASYFSADGGATAFGDGYFSTGDYNGDGWQGSHWKGAINSAGNFTCGLPLRGVMNPYLCNGRNAIVTGLDLAAFDAIGWNLNGAGGLNYRFSTNNIFVSVPEPATWAMMIMGFGFAGLGIRARKRAVAFA